jgi:hypothetical protein
VSGLRLGGDRISDVADMRPIVFGELSGDAVYSRRMTNTTRAVVASLLVLGVAACGKAKEADKASGKAVEAPAAKAVEAPAAKAVEAPAAKDFVACDAATLTALDADLDKANCLNVDLGDKAITDACAAMKTQITGKRYALKGCTFSSQGNDEVSFGATGTDKTIRCVMKGGEAGVAAFRDAAMTMDMAKLRLDVSGVLAMAGSKDFERLQMTDCQITAHE